jgi:hypothetical protein
MKFTRTTRSFGLALGLVTGASWAQTDEERAGARAAAEQGVKAYANERWSETVDLMARAERLVHAPTHLLYLAQAEEKQGHLVKAHETYLKILREKLRPDAPEAFVSAQAQAKQRADALRPRLSQVSVAVQGNPPNTPVTVTMDGNPVPEALLGVAHPVDPGEHRFEARGANSQSGITRVQLREGATETVVLTLRAASDAIPPAHGTRDEAAGAVTPAAAPVAPAATPKERSNGFKIGSYVGIGVGVVGVGLGTVFLVRSMKKRSDANNICNLPDSSCPESRKGEVSQLDSAASSAGTIATVSFAVGGVGLAAGITMLLLTHPAESPPPKTAWVRPYFGPDAAGLYGGF